METVKLGTANLKAYMFLAVELANVGDKVGRMKGMARFAPLMELYDEVLALGGAEYKQAIAELKDLDAVERTALLQDMKGKFDLVDDKLEAVVEEGLALLADGYDVVNRILDLGKKLK